jgi:pterin-4a-carbinolamine dehydratase
MMMDTQDTNKPLDEGTLEEEKKTAEVADTTVTPAEDISAPEESKEAEEVQPVPAEEAPVTPPAVEAEVKEEPEGEQTKEEVPETAEEVPATETVEEKPAEPAVEEEKEEKKEVEAPAEAAVPEKEEVKAEPEAPQEPKEPVEESKPEPAEEAKEEESAEAETAEERKPQHFNNRDEVLARLREISLGDCQESKPELDSLKQAFYKLHGIELEAAKAKFVEDGGAEDAFVPPVDDKEEAFKEVMAIIKEKRTKFAEAQEKVQDENLKIKLSIIDRLKAMLASPEDTNISYGEFRKIQQQWNEAKPIPQERANELWKQYQGFVEKIYDILKLNNEFREYDFKKNLEIKTRLCEIAEKLNDEPDVISAFHQLQKLHQEFRDTGPVAKELREAIWQRFKAASSNINRRHQQHFEKLKEEELHNLDQKTVICEIIESIEWEALKSFATWEEKTQEIIALQNKWKTIGFVPKKENSKIFERFRKDCDEFFKRKGEFFKMLKERMNANLAKKRELVKQAESLKDSTDWKATSDLLTKLQKEWKTIGPVSKKYSDSVWKQFISACDFFFEQKNKANNSQHSAEMDNLAKKKEIIAKLEAIGEDMDEGEANEKVHELIKEWNGIGHVPFKEKDTIYEQFHTKVDELFERFHISASNRSLNSFKTAITASSGAQALFRERDRLVRAYETMKSELQTYENNLGFLSSSSKSGSSILDELNKRVEKLKADLELAQQKIKAINDQIKKSEGDK